VKSFENNMSVEPNSTKGRAVGVNIENVNLYFGNNHVLRDLTLKIEPGEFFAFLGPSGCGKTTLLRLIAGFGRAQTGKIRIGEEDVTSYPPWKRNLGMVFQSYALWPHMTVWKNVAFGLEERRFPKSEIHRRVGAVLDLVDLVDLADRRPSQLSGGQQQRVALARTIVVEPKVLLLDEPLSNLDAKLRIQMRQELLLLQRKLAITTIFVTHDQEEANTMADRIAVMNEGVVQQVGTPTELYDNPANRFVASFIGTANLLDGALSTVDGKPVFRTTDGLTVPLASEAASRMTRGVKGCSIVFRPQNVTIRPAEEGDYQGGDRQGTVSIGGIVQHREFLGSLIRYTVAVGERTILVDDAHHRGQPALSVGTSATLGLASEQVILLPN